MQIVHCLLLMLCAAAAAASKKEMGVEILAENCALHMETFFYELLHLCVPRVYFIFYSYYIIKLRCNTLLSLLLLPALSTISNLCDHT